MKKTLNRAVASAMLAAGSLGVSAVVALPTGSASAATAAARTYSGTVKTLDTAKDTFTIKSGSKVYTVDFTAKTKWTKLTSKTLKTGNPVSVTGALAGTVIRAIRIKA